MRTIILSIAAALAMGFASCGTGGAARVDVTVTDEAISTGFIGNGVEWDPYDEAENWGSAISEDDWRKLFDRLDFMRMGYVRCMIGSPYRYYDKATGSYDKTRNIESLKRVLQYCTERGITVMYGEFNPPTWEMKADQRWIDMSVDYLNYLVNDLGMTCIKYFCIFNEPDGYWASTNGDFELWKSMVERFYRKMDEYPGLKDKVSFAAPDVVIGYKNPASDYDAVGWVKATAEQLDSLVGVYDIHSYPGQAMVRSGSYADVLAEFKAQVPAGKKIVLGEAGYKYQNEADSLLWQEYQRRCDGHPYTKGTDSNMLVYDYFYGLDMPLLAMEVMNSGFSGMAAWMLDDAMHSCGDSGKPEDIKLWGMWNILGEEVFGDASQEQPRPWFYTWALMCRCFPAGSDILRTDFDHADGLYMVAAEKDGAYSYAVVNVGADDRYLRIKFPAAMRDAALYRYEEGRMSVDSNGFPCPAETGLDIDNTINITIKAQSFALITNIE